MESLGSLLTRISQRSNESNRAAMPEPEASYEPVCVTCRGHRWVARKVLVGDPNFGQALPCPSCIDPSQQVHRLARYSNLPASMGLGFDDFKRSAGVESAWQAAVRFAKNPRGILTLYGPNGTGKTHLLVAIGNELLSRGVAVKYAFVPDLLEEVRSTFSEASESTAQQIYEAHRYADVLLLDDVKARNTLGSRRNHPSGRRTLLERPGAGRCDEPWSGGHGAPGIMGPAIGRPALR